VNTTNARPTMADSPHKCKDVLKFKDVWTVDADSPEEVVRRQLDMDGGKYRKDGWSEADFKIMPYAKKPAS
jgi:hypothetical protein